MYYSPDVRPLAWALPRLLRTGGRGFVFGLTRREALGELKLALHASLDLDVTEGQYEILVERLYDTKAGAMGEGTDDKASRVPPFVTQEGLQACSALAAEAIGIGNGDGAGAGMDCGLSVAPEDILFADASGRWVAPTFKTSDGEVPTAKVTCIECTKRAVPKEAPSDNEPTKLVNDKKVGRPGWVSDLFSEDQPTRRGD